VSVSDVAQCPFCELRFRARWELKLHLEAEHPGRITEKERDGEVIVEDSDPNDPRPL
jgi:hypothetical protein